MLRLGGDHSFNPHVYLAEKSEICVDSLLEAMTDRDSDDPMSPPGSFSLKKHNQQPPNGRNSGTPTDFGNPTTYPQFLQQYRPEMPTVSKHRTLSTPNNSWQSHDSQRNNYTPSLSNPRTIFPGGTRLHPDAGEFEPGRGVLDYGINSTINPKQRLDTYRNQQTGNTLSHSYGYRAKQYDQSYSAPRSQNLPTYPSTSRVLQQPTRPVGSSRYDLHPDIPYSGDLPNRVNYGISNQVSYNSGPLYLAGRESWDRTSLSQYDSELSQPSSLSGANTSPARLGSRSYAYSYDADNTRSRPTSLNGRADSSDLGLEFDTDRQSFLFPSDYDPGSQSYSIPDYDLLRDAAFANTSVPSYREGNNDGLSNQRYAERDESYGDSKMLSYFLRESGR